MVIPSRPLAQVVLSTRCPRCGVMNYGSSLSPLLCSVTTLGGKSMWFGPCGYAYVCVCVRLWSRMENHLYAHSMERWGSFNFDAFSQLRAREISLCNHSLCSVSMCAVGHLRKIQLCWWYDKEIQSASEHAKEGEYMYETCLRKQV